NPSFRISPSGESIKSTRASRIRRRSDFRSVSKRLSDILVKLSQKQEEFKKLRANSKMLKVDSLNKSSVLSFQSSVMQEASRQSRVPYSVPRRIPNPYPRFLR